MENCVPGTEIEKPVVKLTGTDGNAMFIIGKIRTGLRRAGVPAGVINEYSNKAMSGDYDNVLAVSCEYAEVK